MTDTNHTSENQPIKLDSPLDISSSFPQKASRPPATISNSSSRLSIVPNVPGNGLMNGVRDNFPIRILLNSTLVGAVIGRGGEKIKEMTTKTSARVDVKRELVPWSQLPGLETSQQGSADRQSQVVFIYGSPEACSEACRQIMAVCKKELSETSNEDPNLGLLAADRFCGRIIGRQGKHLNVIREKSGAQISVSNNPTVTTVTVDPHTISLDRIITIQGSLDVICAAEQLVSSKLRLCNQQEMQSAFPTTNRLQPAPQGFGLPSPMSQLVCNPQFMGPAFPHLSQGPPQSALMPSLQGNQSLCPPGSIDPRVKVDEAIYMRIPHSSAGAVIGTDGASIKKIMEDTKTYVNVSKEERPGYSDGPSSLRLVTIKGPPTNQTKAQWQIFQRVKTSSRQQQQGDLASHNPHLDHLQLWTVIRIPKKVVGRVIGKNGRVVQQIQAGTGAIVQLAREPQTSNGVANNNSLASNGSGASDLADADFQPVEIYGTFDSTSNALTRIRVLLHQALFTAPPMAAPPAPSMPPLLIAAPYPPMQFSFPQPFNPYLGNPYFMATSSAHLMGQSITAPQYTAPGPPKMWQSLTVPPTGASAPLSIKKLEVAKDTEYANSEDPVSELEP